MSVRSRTYFIIPFKFGVSHEKIPFSLMGWERVSDFSNCEIHSYIIERFFGKEPICRIYDKTFENFGFYDNFCGKIISIPYIRIFAYKSEISFAAVCAEYSCDFTVEEVISANAALKFLDNAFVGRFTFKPSEMSLKEQPPMIGRGMIDVILSNELAEIKKCVSKSLLFSYTVCPLEDFTKKNLFYLTTGNNRNFTYIEDIEFEEFIQSDDVRQGIAREGTARIVIDNGRPFLCDSSSEFGLMYNYRTAYMLIYIITLCQYYGFKDFNSKALALYENHSEKWSAKSIKQMETLKTDADLFYLRNVHSDISQITHQNKIYRSLLDIYRIDFMISDFKRDIDICSELLEKNKLNSRMLIIAVSTIVAAIASLLEFMANFAEVWGFFIDMIR